MKQIYIIYFSFLSIAGKITWFMFYTKEESSVQKTWHQGQQKIIYYYFGILRTYKSNIQNYTSWCEVRSIAFRNPSRISGILSVSLRFGNVAEGIRGNYTMIRGVARPHDPRGGSSWCGQHFIFRDACLTPRNTFTSGNRQMPSVASTSPKWNSSIYKYCTHHRWVHEKNMRWITFPSYYYTLP